MTRDGKILLAVLLVALGVGWYAYAQLKREVQQAQRMASICRCPRDLSGHAAAAQISQHHRYATTSHSYFERLLEGLVRHAGLPLEKARESLKKSHGSFIPPDWKWLPPWETADANPPGGAPTTSPAPATEPRKPPAIAPAPAKAMAPVPRPGARPAR